MAGLVKNASIVPFPHTKFCLSKAFPFSWGPPAQTPLVSRSFVSPTFRASLAGRGSGKPTSSFDFPRRPLTTTTLDAVTKPPQTVSPRDPLIGVLRYYFKMTRQLPLRAAATAPSRLLLSKPAVRSSPFFTTTRLVSTETTPSTQTSMPPPSSSQGSQAPAAAPSAPKPKQLTYLVEKTPSLNLPVYNEARSGGTRKETVIRKIVGSAQNMKQELIEELKFKKDDVNINPVTGHIRIKVSPEAGQLWQPGSLRFSQLTYRCRDITSQRSWLGSERAGFK